MSIYDIARFSDGEIPADLHYAPKKLARIDTTYYGQKEDLGEWRADFVPGVGYSVGLLRCGRCAASCAPSGSTPTRCSGTRVWRSSTPMWEMRDMLRTYEPGERIEAGYFGGIVRPYVGLGYWVPYRVSDYAQVNVPSWADGIDPMHTGAFDTWMEPATGEAADRRLHRRRAGQAVAQYQGANVYDLPDGEQDWRVVSTATHDGSHLAGSTKTVSEWTLPLGRSAAATGRTGCCR